jgi:hypothetical protein
VLDYHELEGRRGRDGGWWRAWSRPPPPRLDALPVAATEVGRRTLVVEDRRLPLFELGGAPARLVLSVRG